MSQKKRKSRKKNIVIALLVLIFAAYAIVSLSVSGVRIAQEREQIAYLEAQKEQLETQGKEYDRMTEEYDKQVQNGEVIDYAEKVAREKLGLVPPDERVWIDVAGQ